MPTSRIHSSPFGNTVVEERAVAVVITKAIESVPGTIRHASGLDKLTGRPLPRIELFMDSDGSAIAVEAMIAVVWPCPVADVASAVRASITRWITIFTQLPVVSVNVSVGAVVPASALEGEVSVPTADSISATAPDLREVSAQPLPLQELPPARPLEPFIPVTVQPLMPWKEI